mmetsp:Transcript_66375/g.167282  ORF Transcript_66375/g.167282 Transcript_66375/m.167282 type:complete len:221 (+) Transcript_66375:43-705(+)|eukprot:CAMPEP_0115271804 /NCGR_PEP_ID=MMETSP0270-20121206/54295_1 /TAXON_ID=71861 /ORGANISM="Scrippsiella trochoidea, Strain CCMP3099" /LENGTH=220 /DNA_ID=CAMNT_0002688189 /DNA_START=50 /DNA_END=712 /DNA_ORIENTATION=+
MGYTRRSNGSRVLVTSAVVGVALLAWYSSQLNELHDTIARKGLMGEVEVEALALGTRFTPKELGYTDDILDSNLLKPAPLFAQEAAAQGLQFQFLAQGFNHEGALVISLHNANRESSIAVDLPAGMLLAPAENRELQNLVLRESVHVRLLPGETQRLEQWAFCGNRFRVPPVSEMKPTGWILDAPPCQGCVWKATLPYETAAAAAQGPWMAAKILDAVAA